MSSPVPPALASCIEPGIILRVFSQAGLHRIMPEIIPFFQEFPVVPDNAVIALILPYGAMSASLFIDLVGAESFHTVEHLRQVEGPALATGQGQDVVMVRHYDGHIPPPFLNIPMKNGIQNHGSFITGERLTIPAAPGEEVNLARLLPAGEDFSW